MFINVMNEQLNFELSFWKVCMQIIDYATNSSVPSHKHINITIPTQSDVVNEQH